MLELNNDIMSVAEVIVDKIDKVQFNSMKTFENIDQFANRIIDLYQQVKKDLTKSIDDLNNLVDYLYDKFETIDRNEYLEFRDSLDELIKNVTANYISCREIKPLYSSLKEQVHLLKDALHDLKEIRSDFELYKVKIESDQEYRELTEQINNM